MHLLTALLLLSLSWFPNVGPERLIPFPPASLDAAAGSRTVLAAWQSLFTDAAGIRVGFDGDPDVEAFPILTGLDPRVGFDGDRFIVAAISDTLLSASYVDQDGFVDPNATVVTSSLVAAVPPALSHNLIVWPEAAEGGQLVLHAGRLVGGAMTSNVVVDATPEMIAAGRPSRSVVAAANGAGEAVVARLTTIGGSHGVYATLLDSKLAKVATVALQARPVPVGTIDAEDDVDAAATPDRFFVVWADRTGGESGYRPLRFAALDRSGNVVAHGDVATEGASPRVVWTGLEMIVVWRSPEGITGIALDPAGNPRTLPFPIADSPAGAPFAQALAATNHGAVILYQNAGGNIGVRTIYIAPFRRRPARH